jgi:hypothetical protein
MKHLLYAIVLAVWAGSYSFGQVAFTQNVANSSEIQTGFAVITPLSGSGEGLSVSEIFGEQVGASVFRASVPSSPLVTLTNVVINWDLSTGVDTGIAIVNPTDAATTIALTLRNGQGVVIAIRNVTMGGRQQISEFATELFAGIPELSSPLSGLLFISSIVPVGVLGLAFDGPAFTSLPVSPQLNANRVVAVGSGTFVSSTVVTQPFAFGDPLTTPALPGTIAPLSSTIVGLAPTVPITGITMPLVTSTGQLTPTFSPTAIAVTASPTANTIIDRTVALAFPQIAEEVGGAGAFLFPQVATGGGWVSQITIANTSTATQIVRVDFFNSFGGPMVLPIGSTIPSVAIPAGGVVTLSTAM